MFSRNAPAYALIFVAMSGSLIESGLSAAAGTAARRTTAAAVAGAWGPTTCQHMIRYRGLGPLPGSTQARRLGVGLISFNDRSSRVVALDPNGRELFFTDLGPLGPQIKLSKFRDGRWQTPIMAPFSDIGINTEPSFAPGGNVIYFVSNRPPSRGTDIWKVERSSSGWSAPTHLGSNVNSPGDEWHPQATLNGDLYFAAAGRTDGYGDADLYVSEFRNGSYLPARNMGARINTSDAEWDPYVSPAGDYLIFKSNRPGGFGGMDIYSSRSEAGTWSAPVNLGAVVNTADDEDSGEITPDGRYLTFARSKPHAQFWNMYWIAARALKPAIRISSCG